MEPGVNQKRERSERRCGDKGCYSVPGSGVKVRNIGIWLHGRRFDRFWFGSRRHSSSLNLIRLSSNHA